MDVTDNEACLATYCQNNDGYHGTSFKSLDKNGESPETDECNKLEIADAAYPCWSSSTVKTLIGLLIVFFLAISWVGSQQFAQSAVLSEDFSAPFFTTWFGTCWMVLCFPFYCLFVMITDKDSIEVAIGQSLRIFSEDTITAKEILTKVLGFNVLWIVTNYLYIFSLTYIAATDASAILSSNVAIVYALSFVFLRENFYIIRVVASLTCIAGVTLFAYADGFEATSSYVGVIMAILSAFGSASYKVFFKRTIFEGSLGQVSMFLSLLGATNAAFLWLVFLVLYLTGVEDVHAATIPWPYLCGSSALSLVFNFLVNFGVAFTFPLFISIAMMLGIPLNAGVDMVARGVVFSPLRLVAALLVVAGFCLMMCPDRWNYPLHRAFRLTLPRCPLHDDDDDADPIYPVAESDDDDVTRRKTVAE